MRFAPSAVLRFSPWLLAICACGGSQTPERGETFCQSYELNYTGTCRSQCEGDLELGDTAGIESCQKQCKEDLKADDTFSESCEERAQKL